MPGGASLPGVPSLGSSNYAGVGGGAFTPGGMSVSSDSLIKTLTEKASKASLLLIGKPGVGKTTLLRELAEALSKDRGQIVVIVDKV